MMRLGWCCAVALWLGAFGIAQGQDVKFSISGGPDGDKFEIVEGNQLKLKEGVAADYEAQSELEVEITADNGVSTASTVLTVEVQDVAELASVTLDNQTIKENEEGAKVGGLSAVLAANKASEEEALTSPSADQVDQVSFPNHIQPIFQARCIECHGPDEEKGDLRLDQRDSALGNAIIAGEPEESELYKRVTLPPDDIDIMPSEGEPLSENQIELIRKWIAQGAEWPEGGGGVSFVDTVQPIFEARCYECHGSEEQKGDLRLDLANSTLNVLTPGKPEESELYNRITLPADHADIMPAEGDPLSSEQIAAIETWIRQGATWPESLKADYVDYTEDVAPVLGELSMSQIELLRKWIDQGAEWPREDYYALIGKPLPLDLTDEPVSNEEQIAMAQLKRSEIPVRPVAQDSNWVRVDFSLVDKEISDSDLAPLAKMPHLMELDLAKTGITDAALQHIADLPNLTHLNLNNTSITDKGLAHLAGLPNLRYLNLYGTQVTDAGLEHLKGLKTLDNLYVWQTDVTASGVEMLEKTLPGVRVNRGVELAEKREDQASSDGENDQNSEDERTTGSIAQVLLKTFSE